MYRKACLNADTIWVEASWIFFVSEVLSGAEILFFPCQMIECLSIGIWSSFQIMCSVFFELIIFWDIFFSTLSSSLKAYLIFWEYAVMLQICEFLERRQLFLTCISFAHVELQSLFLVDSMMTSIIGCLLPHVLFLYLAYFLETLANWLLNLSPFRLLPVSWTSQSSQY